MGDSHLSNSGFLAKQLRLLPAPLSASPDCTACWDTGGLNCHLSPPRRMSRNWRVGEKRTRRRTPGRGLAGGVASVLPPGFWAFCLLDASNYFLLCPVAAPPLPLTRERIRGFLREQSLCTHLVVTIDIYLIHSSPQHRIHSRSTQGLSLVGDLS